MQSIGNRTPPPPLGSSTNVLKFILKFVHLLLKTIVGSFRIAESFILCIFRSASRINNDNNNKELRRKYLIIPAFLCQSAIVFAVRGHDLIRSGYCLTVSVDFLYRYEKLYFALEVVLFATATARFASDNVE